MLVGIIIGLVVGSVATFLFTKNNKNKVAAIDAKGKAVIAEAKEEIKKKF